MKIEEKIRFCPKCGAAANDGMFCGKCGAQLTSQNRPALALESGFLLGGCYTIEDILGVGGFGMIYEVMDGRDGAVYAIKEYVPAEYVESERAQGGELVMREASHDEYSFGLERFRREGEVLLKLADIPGIVRGAHCFSENNTAYIVMERLTGKSMKKVYSELERGERLNCAKQMLFSIGSALGEVHRRGILHRDISPDNIFLTDKGEYKLIDFGSFRDIGSIDDDMKTVTLKHGYAPPEQYEFVGQKQGPWTDVYALAATFFYMVTGEKLADARKRRSEDSYMLLRGMDCLEEKERRAIFRGLALDPDARYANIIQLLEDFGKPLEAERHSPTISAFAQWLKNQIRPAAKATVEATSVPSIESLELGACISIEPGRMYTLGRSSASAEIVVSYKNLVSRCHCRVAFLPDSREFLVLDCSENGTFMENGHRLQKGVEYRLPPGSGLYFASREATVRLVLQ